MGLFAAADGSAKPHPWTIDAAAAAERRAVDRRLPALGGWPVSEYEGVKMSWAELERILS